MLPEFVRSPAEKGLLLLSLPLSAAVWYTIRWNLLDEQGRLTVPGESLFSWFDIPMIVLFYGLTAAVLLGTGRFLMERQWIREPEMGKGTAFPAFLITFFWWLLFLLAFYPAPGMNDTVYMMDNPLYAVIQFPWAYSVLYGYGAEWGKTVFGSREPVIFGLALLQMGLIAFCLTELCGRIRRTFGAAPAFFLWIYGTFLPIIGNYAAAAVREGTFSLAVLAWMSFFLFWKKDTVWTGKHTALLGAACLGLMLLRSNGLAVAFALMIVLTRTLRKYRVPWAVFILCAAISVIPGQLILHQHGWKPLFQESMGIPLQQMGRVLVKDGVRDEETAVLMDSLLPEEKWRKGYHPYTVDWVKWDENFHHDLLSEKKTEFLGAWWRTGLANPDIYLEGWLTETFSLWNLDPADSGVQSRFGWALSDENTKHMKPADNDRFLTGSLPVPQKVKSVLGVFQYEASRFIGSGPMMWMTLFFCVLFYREGKREALRAALPLLLNTATLLLSTPACGVYRYSFPYVLGLPVLLIWLVYEKEGEQGNRPN